MAASEFKTQSAGVLVGTVELYIVDIASTAVFVFVRKEMVTPTTHLTMINDHVLLHSRGTGKRYIVALSRSNILLFNKAIRT